MEVMDTRSRNWSSVTVGVVGFVGAFLFLMSWSCDDIGGVSSWERCMTLMGTRGFSVVDWGLSDNLDALIPIVVGLLAGAITWWLLGLRKPDPA